MREKLPEEVGNIVCENNKTARISISSLHNLIKSVPAGSEEIDEDYRGYLPFRKIVNTVFYAEKTEVSLLQVADALAFVLKRKSMGKSDEDYFFDPIKDSLISWNSNDWGPRTPSKPISWELMHAPSPVKPS